MTRTWGSSPTMALGYSSTRTMAGPFKRARPASFQHSGVQSATDSWPQNLHLSAWTTQRGVECHSPSPRPQERLWTRWRGTGGSSASTTATGRRASPTLCSLLRLSICNSTTPSVAAPWRLRTRMGKAGCLVALPRFSSERHCSRAEWRRQIVTGWSVGKASNLDSVAG